MISPSYNSEIIGCCQRQDEWTNKTRQPTPGAGLGCFSTSLARRGCADRSAGMRVTIFYTLLPLATHAGLAVALLVLRSTPRQMLLSGPGFAAFLLGGIVLIPCVLLYILAAIARRRRLRTASRTRLFLSGACNPVPALFLLWLWFVLCVVLSHA